MDLTRPRTSLWVNPAVLLSVAILLQLGVMRSVLRADESWAYFLGHPIPLACAARVRFGAPCPTCGITRAVGLSLHGHWAAAFHLFPAAPLGLLGVLALALSLGLLAGFEHRWGRRLLGFRAAMRSVFVVYSVALLIVWLGDWVLRLTAALS